MQLSRFLILCLPLVARIDPADWSTVQATNEEEAFFLRRIADFWQEGEYGIAKNQMEEFLVSFPNSHFSDLFRVCLGDLLLREKNFSGALASYAAILSPELAARASLNRMQCLCGLEWYSTLADECEAYLKQTLEPDVQLKMTFYLAVSLYHQCLNASKDPDLLIKLAKRAEPYFETLMQSDLSSEVTHAFAHLCCVLKEYQRAVDIYLNLAAADPSSEEEMTFQAALIQAEYDKGLALQSFEKIAKKGQKKAKEAVYNHLVLSFEEGHYEALVFDRELILAAVPEGKKGAAHFFLGRSFLALKKYDEAIDELTAFLEGASSTQPELIHSGVLTLIEAAHQSGDLKTLDIALANLSKIDSSDGQIAKGRLLRAKLLKQAGQFNEAREELAGLLATFPNCPDCAMAAFEWADLEYQAACWEQCRLRAFVFLESFHTHELAPFAWRYLAAASSHTADEHLEKKERFAKDLEALLQESHLFPVHEINDWKFHLAQSYFSLGRFEKAIETLQILLQGNTPFSQEANAHLLLGLCYRDGRDDAAAFCLCGENAIAKKTNLMETGLLHVALFNAYLGLSKQAPELLEKGAEHLYEAFMANAEISKENLLWLGDFYAAKQDEVRAANAFSSLLNIEFDETACYNLGKISSLMGRREEQISYMERLIEAYHTHPTTDWKWEREAKLLLAEAYLAKGLEKKASELFDEIVAGGPALLSEAIAKAYLERAKLASSKWVIGSTDEHQISDIASQFKVLILQRRLEYEPIHFEAALEYLNFLEKATPNRPGKRLSLLEKMKADFEKEDDLLSQDYMAARLKYPDKNQIYEEYMRYIDFEILMAKLDLSTELGVQQELRAKARDLWLRMKSECTQSSLLKQVSSRLQNADVSDLE